MALNKPERSEDVPIQMIINNKKSLLYEVYVDFMYKSDTGNIDVVFILLRIKLSI